jgi:serine/threonine-protein kinase 24/25/MST4
VTDPSQRPTAKELLKHRFIKSAKKTNLLMELIERRQRYIEAVGPEGSDPSDDEKGDDKGDDKDLPDWEWDETVKMKEGQLSHLQAKHDTKNDVKSTATKSASNTNSTASDKTRKASSSDRTSSDKGSRTSSSSASDDKKKKKDLDSPKGSTTSSTGSTASKSNGTAPALTQASQAVAQNTASTAATPAPTTPTAQQGSRPSALTSVIYPALSKLLKTNKDEAVVHALAQLKLAFDAAEKAQSGITHNFIAQIIETLKR